MTGKTLVTQVKSIEAQVAVLKAQMKQLSAPAPTETLADLYGLLAGKVSSSEGEISAVKYHFEWEGMQQE